MSRILITGILLVQSVLCAQPVYYPLEVGNQWDFGYFRREVLLDTLMPNGKSYSYVWSNSWARVYHRADSVHVYQYIPSSGEEYLLADFTANIGDTVSTDPNIVTLYRKGIYSIFNRSLRGWEFFIDQDTLGVDDEYSILLIDSIGMAEYTETFWSADLEGAQIDGSLYGTLVTVASPRERVPSKSGLEQNFPNPFNSATVISFTLNLGADVTISIYDLIGRQVRLIELGYLHAGNHHQVVTLDHMPSGAYTYRLTTNQGVLQREMLLIR